MFFSRENEPDLGDERFGRGYGDDRIGYSESSSIEDNYEPSYNTTTRSYTIPLWMFNASKEKLIAHFEKHLANKMEADRLARKNREIAELEEKLAKLKESK